jgi:5-methylcytosine-specific restriction endonuclease McrA
MTELTMTEYVKSLIAERKIIDYREVARRFNSSYPAVKNLESMIATGKPYYQKSKGMAIASVNNNRARKLGLTGTVTRDEWLAVCEKYDNKCAHCGTKDAPLTMDHIQPLSKGGNHTVDNIQPLCKSCNSRKGNRV